MESENLHILIRPASVDNYSTDSTISLTCKNDIYQLLKTLYSAGIKLGYNIKDIEEAVHDLSYEIDVNNEIAAEEVD